MNCTEKWENSTDLLELIQDCGDGVMRNRSVVEWFGQRLNFEEECDDGNTLAGDGCDELCRIENFMAIEVRE